MCFKHLDKILQYFYPDYLTVLKTKTITVLVTFQLLEQI